MKKLIVLIFLLLILAGQFSASGRGYYNSVFRLIVCDERGECLHEIGHASDHQMGWISDGAEFREALFYFTYIDHTLALEANHEWTAKILFYPCFFSPCLLERNLFVWNFNTGWGGGRELYADMLVWSDGDPENMPIEFRDFYDWQLTGQLIEKLER